MRRVPRPVISPSKQFAVFDKPSKTRKGRLFSLPFGTFLSPGTEKPCTFLVSVPPRARSLAFASPHARFPRTCPSHSLQQRPLSRANVSANIHPCPPACIRPCPPARRNPYLPVRMPATQKAPSLHERRERACQGRGFIRQFSAPRSRTKTAQSTCMHSYPEL